MELIDGTHQLTCCGTWPDGFVEAKTAYRFRLGHLLHARDEWHGPGDGRLYPGDVQRCFVVLLGVPDLGYPDGVFVRRGYGDDVAEAAGHGLAAVREGGEQFVALAGCGGEFRDRSVHGLPPGSQSSQPKPREANVRIPVAVGI